MKSKLVTSRFPLHRAHLTLNYKIKLILRFSVWFQSFRNTLEMNPFQNSLSLASFYLFYNNVFTTMKMRDLVYRYVE